MSDKHHGKVDAKGKAKDQEKEGGKRDALERIQSQLDAICAGQAEICARLERLESAGLQASARAGASREALVSFLDQFRAGEALGEASLGAWIEVSDLACVKGGLRTVQQREGMHARLLEARMKELGATPCFEIPDAVQEKVMRDAADPGKPDVRKVAEFCARFPDIDAALKPIHDMVAKLGDDPETQFLLQTIAQDERSTLEFFQQANELLSQ